MYDKAATEWWFGIMGYNDWFISQQILKKPMLFARHPGGDSRGGDVRGVI